MNRICAIMFLLLVTCSIVACGGKSSPAPTPTPVPACVPSSHPEFAYALTGSNFNQNGSIASYSVDSCTGSLIATTPRTVATGSDPEDMVVDPLGRFAYAANLVSNASDLATISMYTINSGTGALAPSVHHRPDDQGNEDRQVPDRRKK
jgi:6-phosphogluconolactonase (cycloisomerase 2 family)